MIRTLDELVTPDVRRVAVAGHVRPDGDCFGSTTAVTSYLKKNYPHLAVSLYLESWPPEFQFLPCIREAKQRLEDETPVDLFISCDVSTLERIGVAGPLFATAKKRVCFDHHISNPGFADENYIYPEASSCAEVIYNYIPYERLDLETASSIYTGLVHDTGVFQQSNTGPETLEIAAQLLRKGVQAARIIDVSVNQRTYRRMQLFGAAFVRSKRFFNNLAVASYMTLEDCKFYGCASGDTSGIVAELRRTTGAEIAFFAYEVEPGSFRVSFRSNYVVNVSELAENFGGGGHVRASGCGIDGTVEEVFAKVLPVVKAALEKEGLF